MHRRHRRLYTKLAVLGTALALLAVACDGGGGGGDGQQGGGGSQERESLLAVVQGRGSIRCGINQTVPGFGFLNPDTGEIEGFDIDFCKAFAAAVFNTPDIDGLFETVPVTADDRFSALRAGEYDVLVRNTTWTSSRDGAEGIAFTHVNFYDSQGMFVRADSAFQSVSDMGDTAICVTTGTTTELNLADYMGQLGLNFEAVTFAENPQLQEAFIAGRCDGWTSDRSQLVGIISQWPEEDGGPEALRILPDIMSKEPLTPAVLDGDSDWEDAIFWVVNNLVLAEELGVTSANVADQAANPPNSSVANLLGVGFEGGEPLDSDLGLDPAFMQAVLQAVGNYGEIYERHVGAEGLGILRDRGLNGLWISDPRGLQYGIPVR